MVMKTYTYPTEVWSADKCLRFSKRYARDGMGTKYPFPGYLEQPHSCGRHGFPLRFNGGTVIGDEWYEAVLWPLPEVAQGFKWITEVSWGWRLVKEQGSREQAWEEDECEE